MKSRLRKKKNFLWICSVCILCLLCAVPAAAGGSEEPDVQFQKAEGEAEVICGGRTQQRYANRKLYNGDRIRTGEDGSAWIGTGSGEMLRLDAGGCMEIRTAHGIPEFLLESGSLYFHMEGQEGSGLRIRTAAMALRAQDACGWVKVVDRNRVCVYLLSGTAQCKAADPVTGQREQAALAGGQLAECAVFPGEQGDSRCGITVRNFTEEEIDGFVLEELAEDAALCGSLQETFGTKLPASEETIGKRLADAGAERLKHMEMVQQESQGYAARRDPVWTKEDRPAYAMEEFQEQMQEEEQAEPAEDSPRSGQTRQPSGTGVLPVSAAQAAPAETAPAAAQPSASSPERESGSGSSSSGGKKPAPAPSPAPSEPTENQGLVMEGIACNGPDGVIEVREGGKISVVDEIIFRNEGKLTCDGIITGSVSNEGGTFAMSGKTLGNVIQKAGTINISGGTVTQSCMVEGGTLFMSEGMVADIVQEGGTVDVKDGTVTGGCTVEGGLFVLSGGTVDGILQKGGTIYADGGNLPNGCVIEGGVCSVSGGTVGGLQQKAGQVNITGGAVSTGCTIENGGFVLEGGTADRITQKGGTVTVTGGTVPDGCIVEGGKLKVSGGTLRAGNHDAALMVNCREAASAEAGAVTAENADVYVTGGVILGDGADKSAIQPVSGTILIAENGNMAVKADQVFHTVRTDKGGDSWAVRYTSDHGEDCIMSADSPSVIYVTRPDPDGMVQLRRLSDDFFFAAQAEDGDVLTLSGDLQAAGGTEPIAVTGGMREPVRLDLNGKKLELLNQSRIPGICRLRFGASANWKISNGQITGAELEACSLGRLAIEDAVVGAGVGASDSGTVKITDSDLGGRIFVGDASKMEIQNCQIAVSQGGVRYPDIENKGGNLSISDSQAELGAVYNYDAGTVSISKSSMKISGSTGDRTYAGEPIPADTGICNQGADSTIELLSFSEITVPEGIYNTGHIRVADAALNSGTQTETFGTVELSGGTLSGGCLVQSGGSLQISEGILSGGCEVFGSLEVTGGRLADGCRMMQDSSLRMTDGVLEAGIADAALSLFGGDTQVESGTIIGNGAGRAAVRLGSAGGGNAVKFQADDRVLIKAQDALDTVQMESGGNWQFQYGADIVTASAVPSIYVTKKDMSDGMMCLRRLDTDFSRAAQAEAGDVITLGADVTYEGIVQASGGTEAAPVTLDLNDKILAIRNPGNNREVFGLASGVWIIGDRNRQGKIAATYDGSASRTACIYMTDSMVSIADMVMECDIWGDRGSKLSILDSTVGRVSNKDHSSVNISRSEMGAITNENYSTADITGTKIQEIKYPGAAIYNRDYSILKISGKSEIQIRCSGANINNTGSSELDISDTSLDISNGIENTGSLFHMSDSSMEIIKYGNGGKLEITNTGELSISSSVIMPNSSYKGEGVRVYNAGQTTGALTLSDVDLTGYIYSGGIKCILTRCNLTVAGSSYGVNADNMLQIDGGKYRQSDTGADKLEHMICFNAILKGTAEHRLEIGGGAILDTSGSNVIPLALHKSNTSLETSNFEMEIGDAVIKSGSVPAIRGFIIEDTKHPGLVTRQNIQIKEDARISSECPEGTVVLENKGNCPVLLELQGGEVINESQGPALCISNFSNLSGFARTQVGTKGPDPLARWTGSDPDTSVGLPQGYTAEEKDGYHWLVWKDVTRSADFTEAVPGAFSDPANAEMNGAEGDADAEGTSGLENSEVSEDGGEENGTDETSQPSAGTESESAESEEKQESGTEQPEGEKDPESASEPTEDRKESESESPEGGAEPEESGRLSGEDDSSESGVLPPADSDAEEAGGAPSSEPDGSGDASGPSEKDRRTEDAALPSDEEKTLKKEESEADQGGR